MPEAWSDKRERQYEHVKESELDRGKSEEEAKEIAARTVNKERQKRGETKREAARPGGTGNPHTALEDRTWDELYNRAKELGVEGRSDMSKAELAEAVRQRNG